MKREREDIRDRELLRQARLNALRDDRSEGSNLSPDHSLEDNIKMEDAEKINKEEIVSNKRARLDAIRDDLNEGKIENVWSLIEEATIDARADFEDLLDFVQYTNEGPLLISTYLKNISHLPRDYETTKKHLQVVKYLTEKGRDIKNLTEQEMVDIIKGAIYSKQLLIIKYLTEEGIPIDHEFKCTANGYHPIDYATECAKT